MKIQNGRILMGLIAVVLTGITAQAHDSHATWRPPGLCRKLCPVGGWNQNGLAVPPDSRSPDQFSFTTLDDPLALYAPGGYGTYADGVDGDLVVGIYYDSSGNGHGFVYNDHDQTWTTLDNPEATTVSANFDIWQNDIVGPYLDSENNWLSFLYDGRTWTTLNYPLAAPGVGGGTWAIGITGDKIAGYYIDASGLNHGFLYQIHNQSWTIFDDPQAGTASGQGTFGEGVLGDSVIGYYTDSSGVDHGFTYDGRTWTSFDTPLAGTAAGQGTGFGGVSGNNIVGEYIDSNGVGHGFLYDGRTLTPIDDPLNAGGNNASNGDGYNIVGTYFDASGAANGFLATPSCRP